LAPLYQGALATTPSAAAAAATTTTITSPRSHPGEDDEDGNSSRWLGFLSKGKKKGVSDVKLREAEELGGVPRSDRYSSRYVHVRMETAIEDGDHLGRMLTR
jgi:hypothetical protein